MYTGLGHLGERDSDEKVTEDSHKAAVEGAGDMNYRYHIPEELIEGILSRVSYPSLYKAQLLSKGWLSKFSISPREELRCRGSKSFQNLVTMAAAKWSKYTLVSVFGKEIVGYDRSLNCWHKLTVHESVSLVSPDDLSIWKPEFAGSLMCIARRSDNKSLQFRVINTLTGAWNLLPSPPEDWNNPILDFRFLPSGSQHYKILVHNLPCPEFQSHIYDSSESSRTWRNLNSSGAATATGIPGLCPLSRYTDAYIDGTFYCICNDSDAAMILWRFAADVGQWQQVLRSVEFGNGEIPGGMFGFGGRFIIVSLLPMTCSSPNAHKQSCLLAKVYELNLQTFKLIRISTSPPEIRIGLQSVSLVADAETIYFCDIPDKGSPSFACYSLADQCWRCLPSPSLHYKWKWGRLSTFEPGLNPFASP